MTPFVSEFLARLAAWPRAAWAAVRRHPWIAAGALPAAALVYVLALLPFTPATSDLR
jgi:hypothetical protein